MANAARVVLGTVSVLLGLVGEGWAATPPTPEEPLLVIVERGAGATTSPEQVRRAIAEELERPVVGPTDSAAKSASQMLVVTIAPDSVAMQLRATGEAAPRRRIEPVASGESSLRVVAWLAGNLARDQATELMDALPGAAFAAAEPPRKAAPLPAASTPGIVTTRPPAGADALPANVQAPWRLGLSLGSYTRIWDDSSYSVAFDRFEILTPSREGQFSATVALEVASPSQGNRSIVLLGGANRRFTLIPRWLAADVGAAAGLVISRFTENYSPYIAGNAGGGLAFVRLQFAEIVAAVRVTTILDRHFAGLIGLNFNLQ